MAWWAAWSRVGLNYAKVLTIIDGTSGVAVLIERNRDNGVVRGMVDDTTGENMLQMNYLLDINDVRAGDKRAYQRTGRRVPQGFARGHGNTDRAARRRDCPSTSWLRHMPTLSILKKCCF